MRLLFSVAVEVFMIMSSAANTNPPNIILMLSDDMGFGDLGANGGVDPSETPNLDILSTTGMVFSDMVSVN
jgi:arylsulfatase